MVAANRAFRTGTMTEMSAGLRLLDIVWASAAAFNVDSSWQPFYGFDGGGPLRNRRRPPDRGRGHPEREQERGSAAPRRIAARVRLCGDRERATYSGRDHLDRAGSSPRRVRRLVGRARGH